jgi:predicted nucleic acid-binding protein
VTAHDAAVVDTSIIAALKLYDPAELPGTILITAVTLGELSFGPHATEDPVKRARRVAVLQHVEATFDPLPYDQGAARLYGQICAAVRAAGRQPRRRTADLMIAATAASNQLPLYTANPDDFKGVEGFVEVVGIQARPNSLRVERVTVERATGIEPALSAWESSGNIREPGMVHDEPGMLVTWSRQDEGMAATSTDCD